jgi:MtN3 and saliva related transmembrane protein
MDWKEATGLIGGFLTTIGMIPQVWMMFKLKRARDISMTFSVTLAIGFMFWLAYGILHNLVSVIFWNVIALVLGGLMVYAKVKWGKR